MTIIFYDITTVNKQNVSANTLRTILCLRLKGLAFKTEKVDLADVQSFAVQHGFEPTSKNSDGSPFYTLPAIYDPATDTKVADSWKIALYLDKTYPNTPQLLPSGTIALQRAFTDSLQGIFSPALPFNLRGIYTPLPSKGRVRYEEILMQAFGRTLEELIPKGADVAPALDKYRESLDKLDAWYASGSGPFLTGGSPVWADLAVVAVFIGQKQYLEYYDEVEWREVASWHNGRWEKLIELFEKHLII